MRRLDDLVGTLVAPPRRILDARLARHQVAGADAVLAILERFGGALLADDVGLGKSYVAAAVASHLAKAGVESELVVPSALVTQWRGVLRMFEVDARVFSHDSLHSRAVMPGAFPPKLVIVDEAHRFRNPSTRRSRTLARCAIGNRLLLVTATPVCNSRMDLLALLRMAFADDAFRGCGVLSIEAAFHTNDLPSIRRVVGCSVVRRGKDVLPVELDFGDLSRRVIRHETYDAGGELPALFSEMEFPLIARRSERRLLRMFLWRRLESSEAACLDSLKRQRRFYRRARESMLDGCRLTKEDFRRLFGDSDDDAPFQDLLFRDLWMRRDDGGDLRTIDRETGLLDRAIALLGCGAETKVDQVEALLRDGIRTIVFTGSIATARSIHDRVRRRSRCALITSRFCRIDTMRSDRDAVLDRFATGGLEVLVTTDLAAEGLNLQAAARIVHFDLPWNPVKLDQRNGRAFRIGQECADVEAVYFIPARKSDRAGVLAQIARKNRRRREILDATVLPAAVEPASISGRCFVCCPDTDARLWVIQSAGIPSLLLEREASLVEDPRAIAAFLDEHRECAASADDRDLDLPAICRWAARAGSRLALPPALPATLPQPKVAGRFRALRALTDSLSDLLAHRYTTGVEALLGEIAGESIDRARAGFVEDVLSRERSLGGAPGFTVVAVVEFGAAVAAPSSLYRADWKTAEPVVSSSVDA